jgi:hypothetical protein
MLNTEYWSKCEANTGCSSLPISNQKVTNVVTTPFKTFYMDVWPTAYISFLKCLATVVLQAG